MANIVPTEVKPNEEPTVNSYALEVLPGCEYDFNSKEYDNPFKPSPEKQRQLISLASHPIKEAHVGDTQFAISQKWFNSWKEYVDEEHKVIYLRTFQPLIAHNTRIGKR